MMNTITLGAEEELQIVDQNSLELVAHDFERGQADFPDHNGSSSCELHKAVVELQTPICQTPDQIVASIAAMREVIRLRAQAQGQRILSAGVHPFSDWKDQEINKDLHKHQHYIRLVDEYADVMRSMVSYGFHVHLGLPKGIPTMAATEHPFHALTFELQQSAAQSKLHIHQLWAQSAGTDYVPEQPVLFSEWPIVASQTLQDKLMQRVESLCQTLRPHLQAQEMQAAGWQHGSAADVLTVDYAIIYDDNHGEDNDNAWDIRLVEFQAFTSLLTMGFRMHQDHSQLWPQLADCPPWPKRESDEEWLRISRTWLAGGDNPALLEYSPWQRGTLFDLHATSVLWNLPIIEPHQITVDDKGRLFSHQNGVSQKHDKILNRLILSELADGEQFLHQLQGAKLHWHSHPAWYFLVHKGLAAELKIPFEPENVKTDQWRSLHLPAKKLVAKNIYSCGGKDLRIGPSAEELDQLEQVENWLVRPRYRPYPVMRNKSGEPVYAEVRLIIQINESMQPRVAMQIVRMYYSAQASASFFRDEKVRDRRYFTRPHHANAKTLWCSMQLNPRISYTVYGLSPSR